MRSDYYHDIDLHANQLLNSRLHNISTIDRTALGLTLTIASKGYQVYDTNLLTPYTWDGVQWVAAGGGGSVTANNGLTVNTTSNVQLGGTLVQITSILTNGNNFTIERGVNGNTLEVINSSTGVGNNKTALYATSTDGNAGEFLAGNTLILNNAVQGIVKITRTTNIAPSPNYNEIGGAIDFINPTINGFLSPTILYTNRIASRWENSVSDPINGSYAKSRFELYGYKNGVKRNLAVVGDGKLILDQYGVGLFGGTPTYRLGVDANGNVIEDTTNSGVSAVTATSPLFSSLGATPNITIQQASGSQDGYLSSGDWTTFNTKEPAITAGTTSQYWRGDKTWQTFTAGGARIIALVTADITGGTAAGTDYVYLVNQTTLVTVTLPPASSNTNSYTIKKIGTGLVNIATTAGTIDGTASPITINVQNVSITLVTNGTNWFII
jgi:hypothetical protein